MSIDKALFRQVAGCFASGVTVVTTGSEGAFHGMTVSAFTSLSLEPTQVLVCIDRGTETLPALQACGRFNVNILSAGQEEASRLFASKDTPESHRLRPGDFSIGRLGLPLLKDALAYLECRVARQYDGGDHVIVVGEVEHAVAGEASDPLLYYRGVYHRLPAQA